MSNLHRLFAMKISAAYPLYAQKAEKKVRTRAEVDRVICWLTGYTQAGLEMQLKQGLEFETFIAHSPAPNANAELVKGVVCGVRVEEAQDPLTKKIRVLDKMVDELAKGKATENEEHAHAQRSSPGSGALLDAEGP